MTESPEEYRKFGLHWVQAHPDALRIFPVLVLSGIFHVKVDLGFCDTGTSFARGFRVVSKTVFRPLPSDTGSPFAR